MLLIDIDHFKHVNDTQGHQAGDAVLTTTAQTIESTLRTEDTLGRWGGEEFLAVLPDTDADGAVTIAQRLRAQVAKPGSGSSDPRDTVTLTIGAAVWASGGIDDLISRADHALYAGKAAGRNNVQLAAAEHHHELLNTPRIPASRPNVPGWTPQINPGPPFRCRHLNLGEDDLHQVAPEKTGNTAVPVPPPMTTPHRRPGSPRRSSATSLL